ncbi:hypothetical protein KEM56_000291 [Ascosphaera pollenicola]|nr:hypothetical protein KEM56_000291 [Ascosphaera pollenicola]
MAVTISSTKFPEMEYRRLGNSGLFISSISLGGWVTLGGHVGDEKTFEIMKQAYDLGINFFDTAEAYSKGESEIVMGKAIKKFGWKRNDLVISTKIYLGGAFGENSVNNSGLSRKHIVEGTKACLARLDLEYVDLIYAHRPDRLTPMEEVVRGFNYVIEKGWAFYWGTSMWNAEEIAEACLVAKNLGLIAPIVEQPLYNVIEREKVDVEYARICPQYGIGLTVWSPLKQGILSGKYNDALDKIPAGTRLAEAKDDYTKGMAAAFGSAEWVATIEKVKKLTVRFAASPPPKEYDSRLTRTVQTIAEKLDCKLAQLALAWVLKNQNVTTCLTGASSPQQVVDNVASLKVVPKLTPEIMAEIEELMGNAPQLPADRFGQSSRRNN